MKTRLRWEATAGDCRDLPTRTNIDICLPTPRSGRLESEICQAASALLTTTHFNVPLHHLWSALLLGVWPSVSREDLSVLPLPMLSMNHRRRCVTWAPPMIRMHYSWSGHYPGLPFSSWTCVLTSTTRLLYWMR